MSPTTPTWLVALGVLFAALGFIVWAVAVVRLGENIRGGQSHFLTYDYEKNKTLTITTDIATIIIALGAMATPFVWDHYM